MLAAQDALARLKEGNERFAQGRMEAAGRGPDRRRELSARQRPFAVIVGCSDSRVPPEVAFDQGLGDLFTVRVAGHVLAPPQIGSVEFAVEQLGSRLVVVLGHSGCGAVQATLGALQQPAAGGSPHVGSLVAAIRPAVEPLLAAHPDLEPDALLEKAVQAQVHSTVAELRRSSEVLSRYERDEGLVMIGAEYSLHTGGVEFFEAS